MYLETYTEQIRKLFSNHKVKNLYVFGSVTTEDFSELSDIDFIVDFDINDPLDYADNYFSLKFALEDLLKKPIDLLEQKGLKNSYIIKSINNSKQLIYEA
jgi:predicted nucleotidyltransferase